MWVRIERENESKNDYDYLCAKVVDLIFARIF